MAAPLILARTFKDAHTFAREELGLSHGYYRVVNSAGTIKAVRGVDLYLVPGWNKRPDRFTMASALKWCRNNVIDVEKQKTVPDERWADTSYTRTIATRYNVIHFVEPVEMPVIEQPAGPPPVEMPTISRPEGSPEPVAMPDPFTAFITSDVEPETPEPVAVCIDCGLDPHAEDCASNTLETTSEPEKPKKHRRRRKCADCEQLHFKGDPCIESE